MHHLPNTDHDLPESCCLMACQLVNIELEGQQESAILQMSANSMDHTGGNALVAALVLPCLGSHPYMACCHYMQNALVLLYMFLLCFHSGCLIEPQQLSGSCMFFCHNRTGQLQLAVELQKLGCLRTELLAQTLIHPAKVKFDN